MRNRWKALAAVVLLALPLSGCQHVVQRDLLAVGTCVVSDDEGTTPVACDEAHTHKVIAIAPRPEDCPRETDMMSSPADPAQGTTTECFQRDVSTESSVTPSPTWTASASPQAAAEWGPLAVIPPQDGSDTARTEGTLRITASCVFLDEGGKSVLLLWPADRTRWDASERTVTFQNADGTSVAVGGGTAVVLGGGGDSSEETGIAPEAWLDSMTWVARPAAGCPIDAWWGVGDLTAN